MGEEMTEYRLYCLDRKGHIVQRAAFEAEGDEQAIALIDGYDPATDRELWQEHRKVLLVPAHPRNSA
jgi:hypothetical protein